MQEFSTLLLGLVMVVMGVILRKNALSRQYALDPQRARESDVSRPVMTGRGEVSNSLDANAQVITRYGFTATLWLIVAIIGAVVAAFGSIAVYHLLF